MRIALAAGLVLGFTGLAGAQSGGLVDPTRPPRVAVEQAGAPERKPAGPQLQSVLISPTRRIAVISGSAVPLGGRYGEATVASISEATVVLKYGNRRQQTLHLVPEAQKRLRDTDEAAHHGGKAR